MVDIPSGYRFVDKRPIKSGDLWVTQDGLVARCLNTYGNDYIVKTVIEKIPTGNKFIDNAMTMTELCDEEEIERNG